MEHKQPNYPFISMLIIFVVASLLAIAPIKKSMKINSIQRQMEQNSQAWVSCERIMLSGHDENLKLKAKLDELVTGKKQEVVITWAIEQVNEWLGLE